MNRDYVYALSLTMGVYTTYELEFLSQIDWDELDIHIPLTKMNCFWLYLRDFPEERLILSVYSTTPLTDVLAFLSKTYKASLRFREYGTTEWRLG